MPASTPVCLACGAEDHEPWAQATDWEYRTSDDVFAYLHCRRCGVLFIDPVPDDRLDEIYPPNYYAYAQQNRSLPHRIKDHLDGRLFSGLLRQIQAPSVNLLDVGGGDGWQLSVIRALDPRVAVTQIVDIDPKAAEIARRNGHRYALGQIEDFTSDVQFDLVILLNLIEHVKDPENVLQQISRLLAPGGLVVVKTPNYDSLDARLFRHGNWGGYHCPRHWVIFDEASFLRLAERAGFEARSFTHTQGAPFWAISLVVALARWGIASVTRERPVETHPLFAPLLALFAAFDMARAALGGRPSQMFVVLERATSPVESTSLRSG